MEGEEVDGTAEGGERQGGGAGEGWKRLAVAVTAATVTAATVAPAVECEVFMLKIDTDGAEAAVLVLLRGAEAISLSI
jgi:hypothetical protein